MYKIFTLLFLVAKISLPVMGMEEKNLTFPPRDEVIRWDHFEQADRIFGYMNPATGYYELPSLEDASYRLQSSNPGSWVYRSSSYGPNYPTITYVQNHNMIRSTRIELVYINNEIKYKFASENFIVYCDSLPEIMARVTNLNLTMSNNKNDIHYSTSQNDRTTSYNSSESFNTTNAPSEKSNNTSATNEEDDTVDDEQIVYQPNVQSQRPNIVKLYQSFNTTNAPTEKSNNTSATNKSDDEKIRELLKRICDSYETSKDIVGFLTINDSDSDSDSEEDDIIDDEQPVYQPNAQPQRANIAEFYWLPCSYDDSRRDRSSF